MKQNRRDFLKLFGACGVSIIALNRLLPRYPDWSDSLQKESTRLDLYADLLILAEERKIEPIKNEYYVLEIEREVVKLYTTGKYYEASKFSRMGERKRDIGKAHIARARKRASAREKATLF